MFLLSRDLSRLNLSSWEDHHQTLRSNGCHSPTEESIWQVFCALKRTLLVSKLTTTEENKFKDSMPLLDLLRFLNGPDAQLDLTGNGYEFSGWYSELFVLSTLGLIDCNSRAIRFRVRFRDMVGREPEEERAELNLMVNHPTVQHVLMGELLSRIQRFGLTKVLLFQAYADKTNSQ